MGAAARGARARAAAQARMVRDAWERKLALVQQRHPNGFAAAVLGVGALLGALVTLLPTLLRACDARKRRAREHMEAVAAASISATPFEAQEARPIMLQLADHSVRQSQASGELTRRVAATDGSGFAAGAEEEARWLETSSMESANEPRARADQKTAHELLML